MYFADFIQTNKSIYLFNVEFENVWVLFNPPYFDSPLNWRDEFAMFCMGGEL